MKRQGKIFCFKTAIALGLAFTMLMGVSWAWAEPWKFGVMSDTQWSSAADAANNPGTVAVGIINQLNQQFIDKEVKFVLQVGDLDDKETNYNGLPQSPRLGITTRAAAAQALYDAGIGFFPLRGNHEASSMAAVEVQNNFPQTQGGDNSVGATNFSSPSNSGATSGLTGLSYAFTYNNARFVLLDQFDHADGTSSGSTNQNDNNIANQQGWIDGALDAKPAGGHAFVFSHKQLFGGNHTDTLFRNPTSNAPKQNAFIGSLDANKVGYIFTGHDHMHNLSLVTSPDGASQVHQVICASDSYKFYTPGVLASHGTDTVGPNAGQLAKNRETEISQELWSSGYYIVTVDGPRVTVDLFAADPDPITPGLDDLPDLMTTPNLTFYKRETFGYSLNGKEILVPQGGSYALTDDTSKAIANGETGYVGTTAAILSGTNGSTGKDYNNRGLTKAVNTGWAPKDNDVLESDILTLWGMADSLATTTNSFGARNTSLTDSYVLSMSYGPGHSKHLGNGGFGVATKDVDGNWINAVDNNVGGAKKFVHGPWDSSYGLGTYGVDPPTKTAWAVINYTGDFAVANGIEPVPGHRK